MTPKFKIDWDHDYGVYRLQKYGPFNLLKDYFRMKSFPTIEEARTFIETIKDLPEYH